MEIIRSKEKCIKWVCFFYGKLKGKNGCYLVFGDKKEVCLFQKGKNTKHGWLLQRKPMLHSRRGALKIIDWNVSFEIATNLVVRFKSQKNESRYLFTSFYKHIDLATAKREASVSILMIKAIKLKLNKSWSLSQKKK